MPPRSVFVHLVADDLVDDITECVENVPLRTDPEWMRQATENDDLPKESLSATAEHLRDLASSSSRADSKDGRGEPAPANPTPSAIARVGRISIYQPADGLFVQNAHTPVQTPS